MKALRIGRIIWPALMLLAACQANPPAGGQVGPAGSAAGTGASASTQPTAAPPSPAPAAARAGLAANGTVMVMRVGQRLVVELAEQWTAPAAMAKRSSVTAPLQPLRRDGARGFPVPGPASATFTAVRVGSALVTAETDYPCLHATPACALPQQLFTITVQVLPRPGDGAGPLPVPPPS